MSGCVSVLPSDVDGGGFGESEYLYVFYRDVVPIALYIYISKRRFE